MPTITAAAEYRERDGQQWASTGGGFDTVNSLVHELVDRVFSDRSMGTDGEDVLLDITVAGVRCLLLRIQQPGQELHHIPLSPREIEIARMVAKGLPNKTIAAVLDISTWTVGTHMRRVFAKLGVGSRAAMVARLAELGFIENGKPAKPPAMAEVVMARAAG